MQIRILIADDDPTIIEGYLTVFPKHGIEIVDTAKDGLELVKKYRLHADRTDLILTDYNMPWMNGLVAATTISAINPKAKIILITGNSLNFSEASGCGICKILTKPIETKELIQQIFQIAGESKIKLSPFARQEQIHE